MEENTMIEVGSETTIGIDQLIIVILKCMILYFQYFNYDFISFNTNLSDMILVLYRQISLFSLYFFYSFFLIKFKNKNKKLRLNLLIKKQKGTNSNIEITDSNVLTEINSVSNLITTGENLVTTNEPFQTNTIEITFIDQTTEPSNIMTEINSVTNMITYETLAELIDETSRVSLKLLAFKINDI